MVCHVLKKKRHTEICSDYKNNMNFFFHSQVGKFRKLISSKRMDYRGV